MLGMSQKLKGKVDCDAQNFHLCKYYCPETQAETRYGCKRDSLLPQDNTLNVEHELTTRTVDFLVGLFQKHLFCD